MKIIFYGNRYMGMCVLSYLVAKGNEVKVITEDDDIRAMCGYYGLEEVTLDTMGEFDLFLCCHGKKIIPPQYIIEGKFLNMHPCLYLYKGHDPIRKYMKNKDRLASVGCHYLVEEVDAGEVIYEQFWRTPEIKSYGEFYNMAIPHYFKCIDIALKYYANSISRLSR